MYKRQVDELINTDLTEAIKYGERALDLSRQIGDKEGEALALYNLGRVLYETAERPASLGYFTQSEKISEAIGLKELQVKALMDLGRYNRYVIKDSTKTVNSFFKAIEISKTIDFDRGLARSYAKLASFYTKYNEVELCENYLDLSAPHYINDDAYTTITHYYTEVGDKLWDINPNKSMDLYFKGKEYSVTPSLMVSFAKAYSYIGDNETALNYLEEAIPHLEITEKRKRMLGIAMAQLAKVYIQMGDYAAADNICDEGIELLKKLGRSDQEGMPSMYRIKGVVMEHKNKDEEALKYYTKSYDEAQRIKVAYEGVKSLITIGVYSVSYTHLTLPTILLV